MSQYYLAVDLGASSGRHILGRLDGGRLHLEEIYRFDNGMELVDGVKCWDADRLFREILTGMKKCRELGKIPVSVGVDAWGVDFVLLDKDGNRLGPAVGYRDSRTEGMDAEVEKFLSEKELYYRTGIQKMLYNTVYQLMAVKKTQPELLKKAAALLMTPDYYNYLLTGRMASEYTIASTSMLVSPVTKDWDRELIDLLGYPQDIFLPLRRPGTVLGPLSQKVRQELGFDCEVVLVASHDTASAVLAVPGAGSDSVYISSGTWSLLGTELENAICNEKSRAANFANEGGYDYRFRFLKNIMGLWMIQSVRAELGGKLSYDELCRLAGECDDFPSRVDPEDDRFFAPAGMIAAVQDACRETSQPVPHTPGELARVIYASLAEDYARRIGQLEDITGKRISAVSIVGGGSNAEYLNALTARVTGRTVCAGPAEAAAIGNVAAQMLNTGVFSTVESVRQCIFDSFGVKTYLPE